MLKLVWVHNDCIFLNRFVIFSTKATPAATAVITPKNFLATHSLYFCLFGNTHNTHTHTHTHTHRDPHSLSISLCLYLSCISKLVSFWAPIKNNLQVSLLGLIFRFFFFKHFLLPPTNDGSVNDCKSILISDIYRRFLCRCRISLP